jgi:hypothetical protein
MSQPAQSRRVPLAVKLVYTAFVAVLVPVYWHHYGPANFLFFCDVALLMTVPALWLESPLWASMPAVGILIPQALWMADFLAELVGLRLTGMTAYMFDPNRSLFLRGLSLFHFWLPILLVWLVARVGYDRRAFLAWVVVAEVLTLVSYFFLPPPPAPPDSTRPVNINNVYGFRAAGPQTLMPPPLYLVGMMIVLPLGIVWPSHWLLGKLFGRPQAPK